MKTCWRQIAVAFFVGAIVGGVIVKTVPYRYFHRMSPDARREKLLNRFTKELKLDEEQRQKMGTILKATHEKMAALRSESQSKFESLREESAELIRKILRPEQLGKYEEMRKKHQERRRKWR